jgi:hypothetical protein
LRIFVQEGLNLLSVPAAALLVVVVVVSTVVAAGVVVVVGEAIVSVIVGKTVVVVGGSRSCRSNVSRNDKSSSGSRSKSSRIFVLLFKDDISTARVVRHLKRPEGG